MFLPLAFLFLLSLGTHFCFQTLPNLSVGRLCSTLLLFRYSAGDRCSEPIKNPESHNGFLGIGPQTCAFQAWVCCP